MALISKAPCGKDLRLISGICPPYPAGYGKCYNMCVIFENQVETPASHTILHIVGDRPQPYISSGLIQARLPGKGRLRSMSEESCLYGYMPQLPRHKARFLGPAVAKAMAGRRNPKTTPSSQATFPRE